MDLELSGKRALVTGASTGIGRATVLNLAREGCDVAFCARRTELLEELADEARAAGAGTAVPITVDLQHREEIDRFVDTAAAELGGLDIVVNNAGASVFGTFLEVDDEQWIEDVELKLIGYVRVCRAAVPHLQQAGGGRIVNVTGVAGKQPQIWHLPGGAANAAVANFSHALAAEFAKDGINVVALSPGPVTSERSARVIAQFATMWKISEEETLARFEADLPLKRMATPEEIADTIAFLVSARAGYITGTSVTVDGGYSRWI